MILLEFLLGCCAFCLVLLLIMLAAYLAQRLTGWQQDVLLTRQERELIAEAERICRASLESGSWS